MTVIAYRNGILAGDGRETIQNTEDESWYKLRDDCVKVHKLKDGSLFGAAHTSEDIERLHRRLHKKPWATKLPKNMDIIAIRVTPDGKYAVCEGALWTPCNLPFFALGSGGLVATAAMKAGATAREAVLIACDMDLWCGGLISTVTIRG